MILVVITKILKIIFVMIKIIIKLETLINIFKKGNTKLAPRHEQETKFKIEIKI